MADARAAAAESAASDAGDGGAAEGHGKRARAEGDEGVIVVSSSSSSSSSSSAAAALATSASRRSMASPAPAPPSSQPLCARRRTAAERARLVDLILDVIGVVVAHNRGQFAHECWQCQYLCRETRYIAGVTQPGSVADLVFHGCLLGGVSELLEEARKCKREEYDGWEGTTQLIRAAMDNDVERVRQLFRLGCPTAVVKAQDAGGCMVLFWASARGHEAVVRELLVHGADVNIKENSAWTPLISASCEGHLAVVRLLCDAPRIDLLLIASGSEPRLAGT